MVEPILKEIRWAGTPQEAFLKINRTNSFLLESARIHPLTGRYSFVGFDPFLIFKSKGKFVEIITKDRREALFINPILELRELFEDFKAPNLQGLPNFVGGAVGYIGYDNCRLIERLPDTQIDDLNLPDIYLLFVDKVLVFDHLKDSIYIVANIMPGEDKAEANKKIDIFLELLEEKISEKDEPFREKMSPEVKFNMSKEGFEDIVSRAKEYIRQGDIFQANLSQRISVRTEVDPFKLYQLLTQINPSPFAAFLNLEGFYIASSSPERLLLLEGDKVQTRPIAGTRPRGKDRYEDLMFSSELILSQKERAEHIMLVDLERNDLGRVCEYGSVVVDELMTLEEYSHVIHIVSNVKGRLHSTKDRFDLIKAAFPGGTITGTPKVRCMEIIDELEPTKRAVYTGSIGYLSFSGDMDLNIVIRTFLIKNGWANIQVGAGIVADSEPEREYYETLYKAQALLEALLRTRRARCL